MLSGLFLLAVIGFCYFLCSFRVVVLMHQQYLECWWVLFLFFLTFIFCLCHSFHYYYYYYYYDLLLESFSHQCQLIVFHWSLSDSKYPQVFRTLLRILTDFHNAVVWMVSTRPLISKFSSPLINPLVTVLRAPIIIDINVTFIFHIFFSSLVRSRYSSFFSLSFNFTLWSAGTEKSTILQVLCFFSFFFFFFFLIIIRSGRLAEIKWSVWMSKFQRSLCVSISRTDVGLCKYHLFVWSNFSFLHNSQWIILPTQSCLVLYSFCANLQHSLIMWLIILSLSLHNLHLLFCCGLSILALIGMVLILLFCAGIRRDSVSL